MLLLQDNERQCPDCIAALHHTCQHPMYASFGNVKACMTNIVGSLCPLFFQAVRASSAAPYYLDDFVTPDGKRFQDGATTANNPAALALQQARLLHPQLPVDCLVSLGCGSAPPADRSKGLSSVRSAGHTVYASLDYADFVRIAYCWFRWT